MCRTGTRAGRRALLFLRGARTDIREVLAHAHFPEKYWSLENVIPRGAAAVAPFSLDIIRRIIGTDLLAVTIGAAICSVNKRTALDHSRLRHWVNVCAFLVGLRIQMSDLPIWNNGQSHPGEGERAEDSKKQGGKSFHKCASGPSASTGFRNVGTVDFRPNPKSINPK